MNRYSLAVTGVLAVAFCTLLPLLSWAQGEANDVPPPERVLIYPIEGEINPKMERRVRADIDRYIKDDNVRDIVFEFDTGGGLIEAGLDISGFIFELDDRDVRTYGYVPRNSKSLSAGTMLALACQSLVMGKNAQIGDVQPINMFMEELPEKVQTFVRSSLRSFAIARGYPQALVDSMVTKELEISRIQGLDENQNPFDQFVTRREFEVLPDEIVNRINKREIVVEEGRLLTISSEEALDYGFIAHIISERSDVLNTYGLTNELIVHGESEGTRSFGSGSWLPFFNHPFAKFLMILIGVLGVAIEMKAPGLGFPGIIGVLSFVVFFVTGGMAGTVGTIEIVLFVAAILLLMAEVFLIPGVGVAGVLGLAMLLASLTLALMSGTGEFQKEEILPASQVVIYSIAGSIVAVLIALHFLPKSDRLLGSGLISTAVLDKAAAPSSLDDHGFPTDSPLVGRTGVVVTALRPAGKVEIDDQVIDVVADGEFLKVGALVEIAAVEGHRVLVRSVENS
ncbi:MAG: NfeD family protein [Planctomycetota bacterium]